MMRRSKSKRAGTKPKSPGWWASMDRSRRRRLVRGGCLSALAVVFVLAVTTAMARLDAHVEGQLRQRIDRATVTFVDLPQTLTELAIGDLQDSVSDLLGGDWIDDRVCRVMATRLASVAWVDKVGFVRRTGNGRFEISARYRLPVAMVQHEGGFLLIDRVGRRLPGGYNYDPAWKLIQGVDRRAPEPGERWGSDDVQAALAILAALEEEPFGDEITAVLVENVGGRVDPRRSHVQLATDRVGGRILWGSAPGLELEENTMEQKFAILRENHRRTGRADAHHPVIDISTFPDRFTIPG